jgi:N-acetylneuraminic acid mutarotase
MSPPPTSIDGTDITGATIDGTEVTEVTIDGDVVFSAGGLEIYALTGRDNSNNRTTDVIDFKVKDSTSQIVDQLPSSAARSSSAGASFEDKVYSIAGRGPGGDTRTIFEYNTTTGSVTQKTDLPVTHGFMPFSATVNGQIYVLGGFNGGNINNVSKFDPASNTSSTAGNLPISIRDGADAVDGGNVYLLGGDNASNNPTTQVIEYDPSTETSTIIGNLSTPTAFGQAAAVNGKIYLFGGDTPSGKTTNIVEYDIASGSDSAVNNLPNTVSKGEAVSSEGKIFLFGGGFNKNKRSEVYEYDPAANSLNIIGNLVKRISAASFSAVEK